MVSAGLDALAFVSDQGRPYPATRHEIDAFEDRAYAHEEQWSTNHSVRPEGAR